ncbi:MAG: V-type ATPase subunit [Candidatus Aminicenantales bacterium]
MKRPSRLDYIYSVGRVRALERFLVQRAVFEEAAEMPEQAAALKLIYDAGRYPEALVKVRDSAELDAVLDGEEEALKREMTELILEKDVLDVFLYATQPEQALAAAAGSGYPFFRDHVRRRIDLGNIKIFVRARYQGLSAEKLRARLLEGGFIQKREFIGRFALASLELGEIRDSSPYRELWEKGLTALGERETFVPLERGIEDFLMNDLRRARSIIFGPEPVFAYGQAKRRELALVRLVGIGKMNSVPAELLQERISETYA